jgi:hypothetical protein
MKYKSQIAIRKYLEEKGYAKFEEPRIGRSDRLLIDITPKGYEALGLPVPDQNKGRGSITHRHFAHWIKLHFEKEGYKAYLEWKIPGTNHPVDVAVQLEKGWSTFEICITTFDNLLSHIEACFEKSTVVVESLTVVTATKTKLKEVKKVIQSNPMIMTYAARIKFDVIGNYMIKELKN